MARDLFNLFRETYRPVSQTKAVKMVEGFYKRYPNIRGWHNQLGKELKMKTMKFSTKLDRVTVCIGNTPVVVHAAVEVQITKPANLSRLDQQAWDLIEKHRKSDSESVHISAYGIPLGTAQEG